MKPPPPAPRTRSLERKLRRILEITSAAALLLASGVLIAQWAYTARTWMIEDLTTLAEITANNCQSSLAFQDPDDGAEVLAALAARAVINAACLYDAEGEVFAVYVRGTYDEAFTPPPPEPDGDRMDGASFILFRGIEQNGDRLGTLLLHVDFQPFYQRIQRNILLALLVILVAILLASQVARRLQRTIITRIRGVVEMANTIAAGALPDRMPAGSNDEIGDLVAAFNLMVDATRGVVRQTQTLARGDYSISIEPRSEKDELSHALIQMTEALKGFHQETARQNWLKTALSELNERMRGEPELATLNQHILNSLAASVDAQVGALYLAEPDQSLHFAAGYAYRPGPEVAASFQPGEGLIGQAALERRRITVSDLPQDDRRVRTGMLDVIPREIVVLPLIREEEVIGVMEWGGSRAFTPDQVELLQQATESIAIAINTAQSRQRLNQLLHTTQLQSEELQQQQAALQQTNQEIHRQNQALENAQLDLERKARELAEASRYKSEFLANMSHELRTPLNSLLILSKLLKDNKDGNLTEKQVGHADTIHQAGSDLLTLINDILDLSKVEAGKLQFHIEAVEVEDLRAGFEGIFRHIAEDKGVAFPVTLESGTPSLLRTDRQRVGQILRNLLSNAFKFTAQGEVGVRIYPPSPDECGGRELALAVAVSDTGIGIPAEKLSLVFSAFRQADGTTSRDYGGTGLGLSISKALAEQLGGDLRVTSEKGVGSTFTLYLPAATAESAPDPEPAPPATPPPAPAATSGPPPAPPPGAGPWLLVIENDTRFIELATEEAGKLGFQCRVVDSAGEGMALARRELPAGILLGMMLPERSGKEILQDLKADPATRSIPVYGVSTLGPDQETMRLGAFGFLTKPVTPDDLQAALRRLQALRNRTEKRLLVIEDDERHATSLVNLLEDLGIRVDTCATGHEAVANTQQESYDGVILDLGLADMSGFDLLDQVDHDREGFHVPVIVHTGRDLTRDEEALLRRSAESIVLKSAHAAEDLLDKVKLFLHIPEPPSAPPAPAPAPPPPAAPVPPAPRSGGNGADLTGRTVLIVDDDMRNAYSLAAVFDEQGLEHLLAASGEKALACLEENPAIDLVLMDIMMPGMDGYETMQEIRKRPAFSDLPIVALTAKAMTGDREKCLEAGATDYLPKPVDLDRLLALMRDLL